MNRAPTPAEVAAVLDVIAPEVPLPPGAGGPDTVRVPVVYIEHGGYRVRPDDEQLHGLAERIAAAVLNADTHDRRQPSDHPTGQ